MADGQSEGVLLHPMKVLDLLDLDFRFGRFHPTGYFQVDSGDYFQAPAGPLDQDFRRGAVGDPDPGHARELAGGAALRRGRIGAEGSLWGVIAYKAMFQVSQDDSHIAEVWIAYSRFAPYVVQLGAFPQPANMEDATNNDSTLFLERATAADLARRLGAGDGRVGITLKRADPKWMAALSLTGPVLDAPEDFVPRAAVVARLSRRISWALVNEAHVGASATYVLASAKAVQSNGSRGLPLRLDSPPEVRIDDTSLIDTGVIQAGHASALGLEFAAQRRNLYLQTEAFRFGAEREGQAPGGAPRFYGFYVEGSWILTGERRRFDPSRAAYAFPKPSRPVGRGGWGAWEIALRYSRMNLNYDAGSAGAPPPPGGVRGGDQKILSIGLDWYPTNRIRVLAEWLRVSIARLNPAGPADPEPFGPFPLTPPVGVQIGQKFQVLALRLRYGF